MWPICDPFHIAMFDGVDVDIVHVSRKILLVPYQVLPIGPVGRNKRSALRRMFSTHPAQCPLVIAPYASYFDMDYS